MKKGKEMTALELCKTLKISESLFKQKWLKKKPSVPRQRKGRGYVYDVDEVYQWLLKNNMVKYAAILEQDGFIVVDQAPEVPLDDSPGINIYGAFDRLGKIIKTKLTNLENLAGASSVSETTAVKGLLGELRMYQKAMMDIDKELKLVIPIDKVKQHVSTILTSICTDLRVLRHSLKEELAAEDDPEKVEQILGDRIDDCLRHTADKVENLEIAEDEIK